MKVTDVVFDFDGTCTQIPVIHENYLRAFLGEINKRIFSSRPRTEDEWNKAQAKIRASSPLAPWTLRETPAAPAAADPYILAHETTKLLMRDEKRVNNGFQIVDVPFEAHSTSNENNPAPWRPDARQVIETLLTKGIKVHFISNSSSRKITQRLIDLLNVGELPEKLKVVSDASKFNVNELNFEFEIDNPALTKIFKSVPVVDPKINIGRPLYLRRGTYFQKICEAFGNKLSNLSSAVFVGDIWEMDLAMPSHLGANIHLIERAKPYQTYASEIEAVKACSKGTYKISTELTAVLDWL